jgi:pimeloyl-ACP methyl ester carboxylesterase
VDFERDFEDCYFPTKYGKMHYRRHKGTKNTIIFLHGLAASAKSWTHLVNYLPNDMDVYIMDLLGHGQSDAPHVDYSLHTHYESLLEFVRSNADAEPILFGHSYGGWLAAYYASMNKVSGLVLEDSAGLQDFVEERHQLNPQYRETLVKDALKLNPKEHVIRSMINADNSKTELDEDALAKIKCRCMIIWGSDDKLVNPKYASQFNSRIKGSSLVVINGARHSPHYTNAEEVARILMDFL